ncbi:GNAT family N-acetyltransferase [Streptomyces sp. SM11]|uniref:GNAT family N-acetyltransferase n=1 Tax=Streptomyces sp. SM11 TaxID=565557 RepID=UPI0015E1AF72
MQSWIRSSARKQCSGPLDERVLVAERDDGGFAAVIAHSRCEPDYKDWVRTRVGWGGPVRLLRVVAVDVGSQGQGLGHQAIESLLDDVMDREGDEPVFVLALIHEANQRSQALVGKHDLELAPFPCDAEPGMQYWFGTV